MNGLLAVEHDKGIGFVDKQNHVIIPLKYTHFWQTDNGNMGVKLDDTINYYDKHGKKITK